MKHTTPTTVPRRTALLELQCPECMASVRVARDELVEGAPVPCLHCGMEAELRNDFDVLARKRMWFLVDPLADADAEERRS